MSCLFCSPNSVERKQQQSIKPIQPLQEAATTKPTPQFLTCSRCGCKACFRCVSEIVDLCKKKGIQEDKWLRTAAQFVDSKMTEAASTFIGSCCEHRLTRNLMKEAGVQRQNLQQQIKLAADRVSASDQKLLDGCLFFPQYNLFIDSPNNNTSFLDIHGLGRETGAFDGVWHCVPSLETVLLAEEKNATPQPMSSPSNKYYKQQLFAVVDEIPEIGIHEPEGYIVDIYIFDQQSSGCQLSKKGENDLTMKQIEDATLFQHNNNAEASIVLGRPHNIDHMMPLLLFRFHNNYKETMEMTPMKMKQLYNTICKKLTHSGFECMRRGGSSGTTELSKEFFQFLSIPGSFPRKAGGVKLFREKLQWVCIYRSRKKNCMVKHIYSTPKKGGQFKVCSGAVL